MEIDCWWWCVWIVYEDFWGVFFSVLFEKVILLWDRCYVIRYLLKKLGWS